MAYEEVRRCNLPDNARAEGRPSVAQPSTRSQKTLLATSLPQPSSNPRPTMSSLPRPASVAMPVPRHGALGVGRAPSTQRNRSRSYHPYPQTHRPTPTTSTAAVSAGYAVLGGIALNSSMSAGAARKASRAKRESFKPRPSMDDDWGAPAANDGPRRFAGFAGGTVQEVEEDF